MKKVNIVGMMAIGGLVLSGCNKIEDYSNLNRLTDKEWQLVSIVKNGSEVSPSCKLDNTILFRKDGTAEENFGTDSCDDDATMNSWKFSKNYSELKFRYTTFNKLSGGTGTISREIIELTDSTLVLKETYPGTDQEMPEITTYKVL